MTTLIILSLVCAGFLAGFTVALGAIAIVFQMTKPAEVDDPSGAAEGAFPFDQPSSPGG